MEEKQQKQVKKSGRSKGCGRFTELLCEVFVTEDVVLTETVISCAAGAVTEFQIGMGGVRFAADRTFMAIAPLGFFFLLLADSRLKLDRLVAGLVTAALSAPGQCIHDGVPEEDEEVQQSYNGKQGEQGIGEQIAYHCDGEHGGINPGKPLDLNRDEEKQQELNVRIQHSECKKQGQIHIFCAGNVNVGAEYQTCENADKQGQSNAGKIVKVEFGSAPLPFQRCADHIVQIEEQRQPEHIALGVVTGHEDESYEPPDFTVGHSVPAEPQKRNGFISGENAQQIDQNVAQYNEFHQIGDAESGMVHGEAIHRGAKFSQRNPSIGHNHNSIITALGIKVMTNF